MNKDLTFKLSTGYLALLTMVITIDTVLVFLGYPLEFKLVVITVVVGRHMFISMHFANLLRTKLASPPFVASLGLSAMGILLLYGSSIAINQYNLGWALICFTLSCIALGGSIAMHGYAPKLTHDGITRKLKKLFENLETTPERVDVQKAKDKFYLVAKNATGKFVWGVVKPNNNFPQDQIFEVFHFSDNVSAQIRFIVPVAGSIHTRVWPHDIKNCLYVLDESQFTKYEWSLITN